MNAGVAEIDITPVGPVWMDGQVRAHRSVGVHDCLSARALALSEGSDPKRCFVIVSVEIAALRANDSQKARSLASAQSGVPVEQIVIAATHTHAGPATVGFFNPKEEAYVEELCRKIAGLVRQAVANLAPAAAGCASGREATINHYRRLLADDGHVVMNWQFHPPEHLLGPLGVADPEVGVLKLVSAAAPEKVIALLFNHAGHPNVRSGENYELTSDYPGSAKRLVEAEFGGMAMYVNGAQGSVDVDGLGRRDWEELARAAGVLAKAVSETAKEAAPSPNAVIRGDSVRYAVPARKITDAQLAWAEQILKQTGGALTPDRDDVGDDYLATVYKRLYAVQDRDVPIEQTCIAVGETAMISFPGEMFTESGMRIKARSPFRRTWILGLSNGYVGYVPTRTAIFQGGYEPNTREVDDPAEETIVGQSLALLERVARL